MMKVVSIALFICVMVGGSIGDRTSRSPMRKFNDMYASRLIQDHHRTNIKNGIYHEAGELYGSSPASHAHAIDTRSSSSNGGGNVGDSRHRMTQAGTEETVAANSKTLEFCEKDKNLYHISFMNEYSCDCLPAVNSMGTPITVLICIDVCGLYCNTEGSACGAKSYTQFYNPATGFVDGFANGFIPSNDDGTAGAGAGAGAISLAETNCTSSISSSSSTTTELPNKDNFVCQSCGLSVDTQLCQSCEMITCGDGVTMAPFVDCENIQLNSIFDFCPSQQIVVAQDDIFEYFATSEFIQCQRLPVQGYCDQISDIYEQDETSKRDCKCILNNEEHDDEGNSSNAVYMTLQCMDECWYCNDSGSECVQNEINFQFDQYGQQLEQSTLHTYVMSSTKGYSENNIVVEYAILSKFDDNGNSCRLAVNGVACTTCQVSTCVQSIDSGLIQDEIVYAGTQATCDNLMNSAELAGLLTSSDDDIPSTTIDLCSLDTTSDSSGLLENSVFQVLLPSFYQCVAPKGEGAIGGIDDAPDGDGDGSVVTDDNPPDDPDSGSGRSTALYYEIRYFLFFSLMWSFTGYYML